MSGGGGFIQAERVFIGHFTKHFPDFFHALFVGHRNVDIEPANGEAGCC